jgi:hypothetical protein
MLQQQRAALGGAAASGMKNITGAFGMAAQAANTNNLAEAYGNSGDTYNYNLGGDYANAQAGYDITKGYGWGPASSAAYGIYGQEFMNQ